MGTEAKGEGPIERDDGVKRVVMLPGYRTGDKRLELAKFDHGTGLETSELPGQAQSMCYGKA